MKNRNGKNLTGLITYLNNLKLISEITFFSSLFDSTFQTKYSPTRTVTIKILIKIPNLLFDIPRTWNMYSKNIKFYVLSFFTIVKIIIKNNWELFIVFHIFTHIQQIYHYSFICISPVLKIKKNINNTLIITLMIRYN